MDTSQRFMFRMISWRLVAGSDQCRNVSRTIVRKSHQLVCYRLTRSHRLGAFEMDTSQRFMFRMISWRLVAGTNEILPRSEHDKP